MVKGYETWVLLRHPPSNLLRRRGGVIHGTTLSRLPTSKFLLQKKKFKIKRRYYSREVIFVKHFLMRCLSYFIAIKLFFNVQCNRILIMHYGAILFDNWLLSSYISCLRG
jgi:hypothetical protein